MKLRRMHINLSQTIIEVVTNSQDDKKITIEAGAELNYLLILRENAQINITIDGLADSKATIKVLCIGQSDHRIESNIVTSLIGNNASADVYILSLLQDKSDVNIHGNITLGKDVAKVSGHLLEENLILGDNIQIKTAPILDVRSSDVSASHGCRIERIDPKKLFYMQSRGLTASESQSLILDGYLNNIFSGFEGQEELLAEIKALIV